MSILLSNDDGVDAPGLAALAEALAGLDDLYISAPSRNRSGVGMGMTLDRHLTVVRHGDWPGVVERYAIDGTPTDAVKFGLQQLLAGRSPRLVVSGINYGPNTGRSVRHSGTIGAAFEAYAWGVPALAVSVGFVTPPYWESGKIYARLVAEKALELAKKRPAFMLNLNVPALPPERIKGIRLAPHGRGGYEDAMLGAGAPDRFHICGDWMEAEEDAVCDASCFARDYAVVTPLRYEMTDEELLASLGREWEGLEAGD